MIATVSHSPLPSFLKARKSLLPNPNPNLRFCKNLLSSSFSPSSLELISSIHGVSASSRRIISPRCSSSRLICCSSVPSLVCNCGNNGLEIRAISTGETAEKEVEALLNTVKWDSKGLVVAIAQNVDTGAIMMQGFANREALAATILTQKATFYSRSRSSLWIKGETSMNFINVHDIFLDCDRDSIIYLGKPDGPTCHTGMETCYYSSVDDFLKNSKVEQNKLALTTLYSLESTITQRKAEIGESENGKKPSWTKRLLLDKQLLCSKIREEADELCRTMEENEDKSRTASEMADMLYHAMVLLAVKDVKVEDVLQVLRHRFSQSGIEEKNSRKST